MAKKVFNFDIDVVKSNKVPIARVKQLDTATFNFMLKTDDKVFNLENQKVTIYLKKADGKLVVQEDNITITNPKLGKVSVNINNSAFQCVGVVVGELEVSGEEGCIATANFMFDVAEKLGSNEAVESVVDVPLFNYLSEYIKEANNQLTHYKLLIQAITEANVSLESLDNIKQYLGEAIPEIQAETDKVAQALPQIKAEVNKALEVIPQVESVTAEAEKKKVELQDLLNGANNEYVKKSGDIMTGSLALPNNTGLKARSIGGTELLDIFRLNMEDRLVLGYPTNTLNPVLYFNGKAEHLYHTGSKPSWNDLLSKPSTFPPATHNHPVEQFGLSYPSGIVATETGFKPHIVRQLDFASLLLDVSGSFVAGAVIGLLPTECTPKKTHMIPACVQTTSWQMGWIQLATTGNITIIGVAGTIKRVIASGMYCLTES